MILVCGGLADSVTELVCSRLIDCGYPFRFVDLATYPSGFRITGHWDGDGRSGAISGSDWRCELGELSSVYMRFLGPEGRVAPKVEPSAVPVMYSEYDTGLMVLLEDLPCMVVNRLDASMSNNSKAYQALLIRACGMKTPPTIVTNDPDTARGFYEECRGEVIYKSLSGIRSIVRRLTPDYLARLQFLRHGPAQFQAYIKGDNVRVHTVGEECFATRVRSEAVDYRYASRDGKSVEMMPASLPPAIAETCLRIARSLGLSFTGIDLKETPDGEYYCFEVNPCPGFLYYEKYTGQPISKALADLLHAGAGSGDQS